MDKVNLISIFLAGISLLGNYFVNKKNIFGFYIWIIANICWSILYFYIDQKGSFILMIMYIILCIHGILSWKKVEEE